ncbi:hypothetical protein, partial [Pseudomonas sp.]|uniref:hypothetical protein n=1 Tax=Pseudomonas sp. TaxID=306 RepID=UPI002899EF67
MKSPDFNPETDYDLPALSKMLVSLQGALQGRRAYLAGVLRKRLKNLRSAVAEAECNTVIELKPEH